MYSVYTVYNSFSKVPYFREYIDIIKKHSEIALDGAVLYYFFLQLKNPTVHK